MPENEFFKSCGWQKKNLFKPEIYEGSRSDADTFIELQQELPKRHPRFFFVHFGDADEEAHLHVTVKQSTKVHYGIFHYHKALRETDYYIGSLWNLLQKDPFYRDSTYLIVTTDHGRDDIPSNDQWWDHGECMHHNGGKLCAGCQRVFAVIVGPGIHPQTISRTHTHVDLAPTVAGLFGLSMPTAEGKPILEVPP